MAIRIYNQSQINEMRKAGQLVAKAHAMLREYVVAGAVLLELDQRVEQFLRDHGATPSFKGHGGFPASTCISVNDVVCHGIPDKSRLSNGDIVSIDIGACLDGWHGDSCVTYAVGKLDSQSAKLMKVTEEAMWRGVAQARAGKTIGDIGAAMQEYTESQGFSVVREYTGHGIGRKMHETPPDVFNFGEWGKGLKLRAGMTLTIEPIVNIGSARTRLLRDGWTAKTADGSRSAQFEHQLAITTGDPEILTKL